jgi:hypothetical protein
MTTSRAIALLEVGLVENQKGTSQEKMSLVGLRKRIREVAAASRNPDKLFTEPQLSLRPGLVERIHKLRVQVSAYKQPDTTTTKTRSGLVAALSDLPSGPTNISSLLDKMNNAISRDELFKDLLQLHENGLLRLVVDLPEPGDA